MAGVLIASAGILLATTPAPKPACVRTEAEDQATLAYGAASDRSYEVTSTLEHAAVAAMYRDAAELLPLDLLPRALGTKIITKAHEHYALAYEDVSLSPVKRTGWRSDDELLLRTYLAAHASAIERQDPCVVDPTPLQQALAALEAVAPSLHTESTPPPIPAQPTASLVVDHDEPPPVTKPGLRPADTTLVVSGSLLIATGLGLIVAAPLHHAWRERQRPPDSAHPITLAEFDAYLDEGKTVERSLIIAGGVTLAAGAIVLSTGLARHLRYRRRLSILPTLGPHQTGVLTRVAF